MRPPERLDAIDEADEAGPLLESAPPMPSSWIDTQRGGLGLGLDFHADFGGCSWVRRRRCYRLPLRRIRATLFDVEVHIDRDSAAPS